MNLLLFLNMLAFLDIILNRYGALFKFPTVPFTKTYEYSRDKEKIISIRLIKGLQQTN